MEERRFQEILSAQGLVIKGKDVSFRYSESKILFENINFYIERERLLIVKGRSGSGKSTLLMLILGHLEPIAGRVTVNGINAAKAKELLCRHVGYVGAESYIMQGSVRENLLYACQDGLVAEDEELWSILRDVQLDQRYQATQRRVGSRSVGIYSAFDGSKAAFGHS